MLKTAFSCSSPVAIRYPKGAGVGVDTGGPLTEIDIGQAEVIKEGRDVNMIAIGSMVYPCMEAAEILNKEGINAGLINARFAKPVDEKLLSDIIAKTKNIVTVEENSIAGGFGSAVMESIEKNKLCKNVNIKCIGLPDKFIEHGNRKELLKKYGLDAKGIAASVKEWLKG